VPSDTVSSLRHTAAPCHAETCRFAVQSPLSGRGTPVAMGRTTMRLLLLRTTILVALMLGRSGLAYAEPPWIITYPAERDTGVAAPAVPAHPSALREPPEPTRSSAAPVPSSTGTADVHVRADRPVTLEELPEGSSGWRPVCEGPCDVDVPLGRPYRIRGEDMQSSKAFSLYAAPGDRVVLDVRPSSKGVRTAGNALLYTGIGAMGWGVVSVGVGVVTALYGGLFTLNTNGSGAIYGELILVTGLGFVAVGIPMTIAGGLLRIPSTHVDQSTRPAEPSTVARGPCPWTRLPSWREASPESAALPKMIGIPIYATSF